MRQFRTGWRSRSFFANAILSLFVLMNLTSGAAAFEAGPIPIALGQSVVNLNGPWMFHTGDDPEWANPEFDDSTWKTMDLTAPPGAHDVDVGLTGYVTGWGARGYRGYSGYAWYRMHLVVTSAKGPIAVAGPPVVDSAYQLFVNGKLLGGCGRFSGATPTVFSIQPRLFALPESILRDSNGSLVIAIRVWMAPWDLADSDGGGIRIAPILGESESVALRYQRQWLETINGYIVEVVEAVAFLFLAGMAALLSVFEGSKRYFWLCAALVLTAFFRANQAVFFWGQFETVHAYEALSVVLLIPFCLAGWTLAWRGWLDLRDRWIPLTVAVLAGIYVASRSATASWFYGVTSQWLAAFAEFAGTWTRVLFVPLMVIIIYKGFRRQPHETWRALPAIALICVGQFAQELSRLGIQSIWFVYGTGVSRTQFAYAAFDVALFILFLERYFVDARHARLAALGG